MNAFHILVTHVAKYSGPSSHIENTNYLSYLHLHNDYLSKIIPDEVTREMYFLYLYITEQYEEQSRMESPPSTSQPKDPARRCHVNQRLWAQCSENQKSHRQFQYNEVRLYTKKNQNISLMNYQKNCSLKIIDIDKF